MQSDLEFWLEVGKAQSNSEYDKIDYSKGQEKIDVVLKHIVDAQLATKNRLEELSTIS